MNISLSIKYRADGKIFTANSSKTEHFDFNIKNEKQQLYVSILPKTQISIDEFYVKLKYSYKDNDRIFVNGYQSWTDSLEYEPKGKMNELSRLTEFFTKNTPLKNIGMVKS